MDTSDFPHDKNIIVSKRDSTTMNVYSWILEGQLELVINLLTSIPRKIKGTLFRNTIPIKSVSSTFLVVDENQ